jgi:hypothetical protein
MQTNCYTLANVIVNVKKPSITSQWDGSMCSPSAVIQGRPWLTFGLASISYGELLWPCRRKILKGFTTGKIKSGVDIVKDVMARANQWA